jgi:hypothetical protein
MRARMNAMQPALVDMATIAPDNRREASFNKNWQRDGNLHPDT